MDHVCSDPYGMGCHGPATGWMIGQRIDAKFDIVETTIYLCDNCCYWECDHDWESQPNGPMLAWRRN